MYVTRCPRTRQNDSTKKLIRTIKHQINTGMDWKEAIKPVDDIKDTIQREKARKSIIDYINPY